MPARTLFVGLDAFDPSLLERWAGEGHLPVLASTFARASLFRLSNALPVIGGGVWQELSSGRLCGRAGVFFPARQLHTGEAAPRQVDVDEVDRRGFWTVASEAGLRVAVVDLPQTVAPEDLNGVFVTEWGSHDRLWGPASVPPTLLDELRAAHGDYPLWSRPWPRPTTAMCDGHDGTPEQYLQLLDDLLEGIDRKQALLLDLLGREQWDLFACAFSEGQCSGHQLWHFLAHGDGADARLADGIRTVYERIDAACGALLEAAGAENVAIVASHGFVDPTGGRQLMPEVLVRLGYGSGGGASARARAKVPPIVRRAMRRILPRGTTEALRTRVGSLPHPLESPLTKAVALDGDRCSWIRLNLAGREPFGSVDPADAEAILEDIRAESLLLEQPGSGQRIVTTVRSASEAFGEGHHPDVPDLIVSFREDLGALDACQSARVGLVRAPVEPTMRRTGAHPAVPSHLWVAGAGAERNHAPGEGRAVDVAPTLLSLLGVPAPDWVDGRALV